MLKNLIFVSVQSLFWEAFIIHSISFWLFHSSKISKKKIAVAKVLTVKCNFSSKLTYYSESKLYILTHFWQRNSVVKKFGRTYSKLYKLFYFYFKSRAKSYHSKIKEYSCKQNFAHLFWMCKRWYCFIMILKNGLLFLSHLKMFWEFLNPFIFKNERE